MSEGQWSGARRREIASHSEFAPNAFFNKAERICYGREVTLKEKMGCSWVATELSSEDVVLIFAWQLATLVLKVTFRPGAKHVFTPPGVHDHVHGHSPVLSFPLSCLRTCCYFPEKPHTLDLHGLEAGLGRPALLQKLVTADRVSPGGLMTLFKSCS